MQAYGAGWEWIAVVLLGGACGVAASVTTVWLLIRPGTSVRMGPVGLFPRGLVAGAFGSDQFRRDLGASLLASPGVQNGARRYLRDRAAELSGRTVGELLPEARRAVLIAQAARALREKLQATAVEAAVRRQVAEVVQRARSSERYLRPFVPVNTAALSLKLVEAAVPMIVARVSEALNERSTRERLFVALRQAADRFAAQQEGWKGTVARMLVTDRTVSQATDWIATKGVSAMAAGLHEPGTQARMALAIDDSVARVLDKPIHELLGGLAPERVEAIGESTADRIVALLRDPALHVRIAEWLHVFAGHVEDNKLGDLVGVRTPDDAYRLADLASERTFAVLCKDAAVRRRPAVVIWEAVRADLGWIVLRAGGLAAALAALFFAVYNIG